MDIKRVLNLIESAEKQTQPLTEGKNMAKEMVMQHYTKQEIKTPIKQPVSRLNEYFKVVDNEILNVMKEQQDAKRVEVKRIVNRVLERLDEGKKDQAPKPRNFVAKNAIATTSGAGAHKDKKRAEKQGDVKHKKDRIPMDVAESDDWGSMSHREFKRRELQHELGHEDDPEFQRMMRDRDRGPWYIKIDGKIFKQRGEPKTFDWKKGANNYALAILKNKPELEGKIFLTKKLDDENEGVAEGIDIGREWMTDTELDQYVPDDLEQEWRELVGYDEDGNAHPLWANMTGDYEPDVSDPQHRAWMVKVANKWFAMKQIPNVRFYDVRDLDDELEWLVQIGEQGIAEGSDWGEPKEILEDVLQTLEREVEWPLTEVMDPKEVRQLLSPIVRAVNNELRDLDSTDSEIDIRENNQLVEKAVSKAQQRFMGMVHAAKKGEKPASSEVAKVAKGMSSKAAKDFAKTKHKGLPDKKVDEVAGPEKCWPGHRKVGTKPGTGKNAGKRVNDCEKIKETLEVGSKVRVYSNVLKKPVLGTVVELKEDKAYVNYANTKIVMGHPVDKVQLAEVAGLAKFIPGVGLVAGGYDAYQRAKQGDYTGAALSAGAGLAGLVPGVGTAAATGLIGAQMGRDKARTGSFLPSYDEIGAAGKPATPTAPAQSATPSGGSYIIKKGDNLTKIAKANNTTIKDIMAANPQITDPNKIMAGAKLTLPGQSATPAPGANVPNPTPQPAAAPKAQPAAAPKAQAAAPGANVPNPQPNVSAGGASVTNRKLDVQTPVTNKQGNVTTTTSGSSSSATLKGITQDMVMNHPVYKAEMAKSAGKDPVQIRMAHKVAELKAKDAIGRDPSYLQNYKAPAPQPTGNSKIDNF